MFICVFSLLPDWLSTFFADWDFDSNYSDQNMFLKIAKNNEIDIFPIFPGIELWLQSGHSGYGWGIQPINLSTCT